MKVVNLPSSEWDIEYEKGFAEIQFSTKEEEEGFGDFLVDTLIASVEKEMDYEIEFNCNFNPCYHLSAEIIKDKKTLDSRFFEKLYRCVTEIGGSKSWTLHLCLEDSPGVLKDELIPGKNAFEDDPNAVEIDIDEVFLRDNVMFVSTCKDTFIKFNRLLEKKA